jgi:dephospho-CoA kinase
VHIVGLTGGIACGKSTVADLLRQRGFPVIDADRLARQVVEAGQPALAKIVETFGQEILAEDGSLDRRKLGAVVFAAPEKRKQLEQITHPAIGVAGQKRLAAYRAEGHAVAFYEAPLLVEAGLYKAMKALIVVAAEPETQRRRLLARDSDLSEQDADARIAAQLPLADKLAVADYVVRNDGGRDQLKANVAELLTVLVAQLEAELVL